MSSIRRKLNEKQKKVDNAQFDAKTNFNTIIFLNFKRYLHSDLSLILTWNFEEKTNFNAIIFLNENRKK